MTQFFRLEQQTIAVAGPNAMRAVAKRRFPLQSKATPEIGTCASLQAPARLHAAGTSAKKQGNWLRRIGVALQEADNSKLVAKVEALARDCSDAQRGLNQLKGLTT